MPKSDGETDFFQIAAGILQGNTLAPYLFVLVLDSVMHKTLEGKDDELGFKLQRRRSCWVAPTIMKDLDFADDIALLTEEIHQVQEILNRLEVEATMVYTVTQTKPNTNHSTKTLTNQIAY